MSVEQSEKTPGLSADEEQEVSHNQPPRAAVLHETIRYQAIRNWNGPSPPCGGRLSPPVCRWACP